MGNDLNNLHLKHESSLIQVLGSGSIEKNELYYLDVLYCAIENVENSEIKSKTPFSDGKEEESIELHISSELQCQYRMLIKDLINPLEIRYGLEIRKHVSESADKIFTNYDVQPDFVIHNSNENYKCQLIAGEIKRLSALTIDNFAKDINKLLIYNNDKIWGGNPFIYPVFVVFSTNKDVFQRTLKNFLNNDRELEFRNIDASTTQNSLKSYFFNNIEGIKHIICFLYQQENSTSVHNLYDIVKQELTK